MSRWGCRFPLAFTNQFGTVVSMTTRWKVTNRLGLDETFDDRIDAMERAARIGWGARVTPVLVVATGEAIRRLPDEVIAEVTKVHGAFWREHIGALAVRAGYLSLVR